MTNMIVKIVGIILGLMIIGGFIVAKVKGVSPLSWKMHKAVSQKDQIALNGFDPVSYFKENKALKGKAEHSLEWKDTKWQFSSQANLDQFKENPQQYEPQYGGYCSFAVSKGFTARPNPESWYIHEGKLHLFADEDMKKNWIEQLPLVVEACEKKWTH